MTLLNLKEILKHLEMYVRIKGKINSYQYLENGKKSLLVDTGGSIDIV